MSYSEASNRESNNELQELVAAGDEAARTRMIEDNMRLVAYKVEQFLVTRPQFEYLKDDLISEGFVGLTEGVNWIRDRGAGKNPTGLLSECIHKQLLSAVEGADVIRPPRRGKGGESRHLTRSKNVGSVAYNPVPQQDAYDTILECCENDVERAVVKLRAEGYSDAEIGASLGLAPQRISEVRKNLKEKFKQSTR
jgi:DNA-directed RNA polymerase specialized sigma24 family protein